MGGLPGEYKAVTRQYKHLPVDIINRKSNDGDTMTPYPKPGPRKKRKRKGEDKDYLAWIRTQPCARCGQQAPSEPAHQRCLGHGGISMKPPDRETIPLCNGCHRLEHTMGAVWLWGNRSREGTREYVSELCEQHVGRYREHLSKLVDAGNAK